MSYVELSIEERATIQVSRAQGMSLRQVARVLSRSPSTVFRCNQASQGRYRTRRAQKRL